MVTNFHRAPSAITGEICYTGAMTQTLSPLLARLGALKPELAERFGVNGIAVFGSYARGEAQPGSDLDLLLDFATDARPTYFTLARLDDFLQERLGVRVDTVPREGLNPRIWPYIRSELIAA